MSVRTDTRDMFSKTTKRVIYTITVICAFFALLFDYGLLSGIIIFQHQDSHYEILFSYHDKWVAFGMTLPYVIYGH